MKVGLLASSLVAAMLVFSGCAKKSVEIETPSQQQTQQTQGTEVQEGAGIQTINEMGEQLTEDQKMALMKQIEEQAKKIYFDFDRYNIRPDQVPNVDYDAQLFQKPEAQEFKIKVEGNCDEWGTDEYNYALGLKRAKSVKEALVSFGVSPERIMIVSFGESNPECTDKNKACWDKNRRAEFKLLP